MTRDPQTGVIRAAQTSVPDRASGPAGPRAPAGPREERTSRQRFLRGAGAAGAAGALGLVLAACGGGSDGDGEDSSAQEGTPPGGGDPLRSDIDIVNFALGIERLQVELYRQAVERRAAASRPVLDLLRQFADTEQAHVDALVETLETLGGTPAPPLRPAFDDVLAGGAQAVLDAAATLENVGAAAYLGQAPRIASREVLAAVLSIHSVEARHAAALNALAGRGFEEDGGELEGTLPDGAFARPLDMAAVRAALEPYVRS